jgi:hypothetical protein
MLRMPSIRRAPLLAILCLLALPATAAAQDARDRAPADASYFMDFRARSGGMLGHTFVVYGRIERGRALEHGSAGLYPHDKYSDSLLPALIPVAGYVNVKKEGPELGKTTAVYRRRLDARQYRHLQLTILRLRARRARWHLIFYNCNDFAVQVAREMGLWTPTSLMAPHVFVHSLRAMNGG